MSVRLYLDVRVRRAVTDGLRLCGVDTIGECIADLELIAESSDLHQWINRVMFLPL